MLDNVVFEGGTRGVALTVAEYEERIQQAAEYIGMPIAEYKEIAKSQITPRVFLAGCALTGVIVSKELPLIDDAVRCSYEYADAMLKEGDE